MAFPLLSAISTVPSFVVSVNVLEKVSLKHPLVASLHPTKMVTFLFVHSVFSPVTVPHTGLSPSFSYFVHPSVSVI